MACWYPGNAVADFFCIADIKLILIHSIRDLLGYICIFHYILFINVQLKKHISDTIYFVFLLSCAKMIYVWKNILYFNLCAFTPKIYFSTLIEKLQ